VKRDVLVTSLFLKEERMEVERQRYEVLGHVGEDGKLQVTGERKVGGVEKFEFGIQSDTMSQVIGGGYMSHWTVDFLQTKLGNKDGACSRFYYDKRLAVDIGDPDSEITIRKRKLLFRHGFGYLCIPSDFPQDSKKLKRLYDAAIEEYYNYEETHPRPAVLQETTIIDEKGIVRRAFVKAIDIKVGGGVTSTEVSQQRELQQAKELTKKEMKYMKLRSKLHKKLRRAAQTGTPFRNPFVARGKRMFPVQYASAK
jgi:hypothetical protein